MNLVSTRGLPLVWREESLPRHPTVTVELYIKWYTLQLVMPDGCVLPQEFPDGPCEHGESPYVDHVPNPAVVIRWAKQNRYVVDLLAWDMLVGRWHNEVLSCPETPDELA